MVSEDFIALCNLPCLRGIANDASTILKVEYQIRAQRTPYEIIAISAMTMIVLALCLAYRLGDCKWISAFCTRATAPSMWVMRISSWLLVVACAAYIGTIAYGFTISAALPTATVFHLIPEASFVTGLAPFIPLGVIAFAAFGAAFAWLAWLDLAPSEPVRKLESAQRRIWKIFGLPVLLSLFLFTLSAGGWSGYVHTTDNNYMSLAGLVPHSDASAILQGYLPSCLLRRLGIDGHQTTDGGGIARNNSGRSQLLL